MPGPAAADDQRVAVALHPLLEGRLRRDQIAVQPDLEAIRPEGQGKGIGGVRLEHEVRPPPGGQPIDLGDARHRRGGTQLERLLAAIAHRVDDDRLHLRLFARLLQRLAGKPRFQFGDPAIPRA